MTRWFGILLALAWAIPAGAEPPAATTASELAVRLTAGERVIVELGDHRTIRGRVVAASAERLVLEHERRQLNVAVGDIARVRRPADGLWNGALIGLAIGGAVGAIGAVAETCEPGALVCIEAGGVTLLAGMVIGTGTGLAIDAVMGRHRIVYARPPQAVSVVMTPVLQRRGVGACVTVGF